MKTKVAYLPAKLPRYFDTSVKADKGYFILEKDSLNFTKDDNKILIKSSEICSIKLKKYYKVATYINIKTNTTTINFFVPRLMLFNWIIINNYFETKRVFRLLRSKLEK